MSKMEAIKVNGKMLRLKVSPYYARKTYGYYKRIIIEAFNKIGIESKYIDIIHKNKEATVEWYVNGESYSYNCKSQSTDIDNLAAISQVIAQDSKAIRRGLKTFGMVMSQFQQIGFDPNAPRTKTPREIIGVAPDCMDLDYVTYKFRQKAKEYHPDKGGSNEKISELVGAYETLKKEISGNIR